MRLFKFSILIIIVVLMIFSGFMSYNAINKQSSAANKKTRTVPQDYCDGSIKGLEQELQVAFNKIDRLESVMGTDKSKLTDDLHSCLDSKDSLSTYLRGSLRELDLWSSRAEQIKNRFTECMSNLSSCSGELNNCSGGD